MLLNPKILEVIKANGLNERDSILFCTLWWFKKYYPNADSLLFQTLKDGKKVINLDNEEDYRINFLKLEEGQLVLKYPLFVKEAGNNFDEFAKKLAATQVINSNGHINNRQDYQVYSLDKETREAFSKLPELDLDKVVKVVIKHYETTKPAKKLSKYLEGGLMADYPNFYE
jgi:hypothetical protein